jgi:hypothetical protein
MVEIAMGSQDDRDEPMDTHADSTACDRHTSSQESRHDARSPGCTT